METSIASVAESEIKDYPLITSTFRLRLHLIFTWLQVIELLQLDLSSRDYPIINSSTTCTGQYLTVSVCRLVDHQLVVLFVTSIASYFYYYWVRESAKRQRNRHNLQQVVKSPDRTGTKCSCLECQNWTMTRRMLIFEYGFKKVNK